MEDLRVLLAAMPIPPDEVVVAGLCSGANHAIEAGLELPIRGVCAINPILTSSPTETTAPMPYASESRVITPFNGLINRLRRFSRLAEWGEFHAPPSIWWLLDKARIQRHPAHCLEGLAERGIRVALVCGEVEARPFLRRARWSFKGLLSSGAVSFDLLIQSDHALFGAAARMRAQSLLLDRIAALGLGPVGPAAPEQATGLLIAAGQSPG